MSEFALISKQVTHVENLLFLSFCRRHAPPLEKPGIEVNLKPERQVSSPNH